MQEPSRRRIIGLVIVIAAVVFMVVVGFRFWYEPTYEYVEIDDARVTGDLTKVAAPASGRVDEFLVNVGDSVRVSDRLGSIRVTSHSSAAAQSGSTISTFLARVTSPVDGQVATRWVNVGENVTQGQPLVTVVNLNKLWIIANVDEARVAQVANTQSVDVSIAALGRTFHGKLAGIGSATTEIISPSVSIIDTSSGSDTTKKIPVRVAVDWGDSQPMPGMTANVTFYFK